GPPGSCIPLEGKNETSSLPELRETNTTNNNSAEINNTTQNVEKDKDVEWSGTWIGIESVGGFPPKPEEKQMPDQRKETDVKVQKRSAAPPEANQQQMNQGKPHPDDWHRLERFPFPTK
ncbi:hypothetical protein ILYODFUR_013365, partial [Ilyodon furcidens]